MGSPILVAIGMFTGFLNPLHIPSKIDLIENIFMFIGIFLTIAIPEELVFRGILYNFLSKDMDIDLG